MTCQKKIVFFLILTIIQVHAIPKKQIHLNTKNNQAINAQEVKLSDVDLALYQTDVQENRIKNHLKSEITNWAQAKATVLDQLTQFYNFFEMFLSKQQQIGILLVCIICFAFYLMVKSEDKNIKQRKQLNKKKPINEKQEEVIVQILSESLVAKEQNMLPQVSTILGSIHYEERVNKSADNLKKNDLPFESQGMQRSSSQPIIKPNLPDYSAEEINSLLKDIN